jgi:hypothetical protein
MTITTIMAMTEGTKYVSTTDAAGVAVGAGVGAAGSTTKLVSEDDGQ